MAVLFNIILACSVISLASLIGLIFLALKKAFLEKILLFLVALSAGTLMAGAFLHLLPEAAEKLPASKLFPAVLFSFVIFFLIEKVFHWRHCHKENCHVHSFGYINLLGDAVHNFLDGLIIAGAFLSGAKLGLIASLAIILHEIPQEMGDFGVLLYAGFSRKRALFFNLLTALTAVLGGLLGYFLSVKFAGLFVYLLPFAAGGFIYIATSDLIPEIKKETKIKKSLFLIFYFLLGMFILYLAGFLE